MWNGRGPCDHRNPRARLPPRKVDCTTPRPSAPTSKGFSVLEVPRKHISRQKSKRCCHANAATLGRVRWGRRFRSRVSGLRHASSFASTHRCRSRKRLSASAYCSLRSTDVAASQLHRLAWWQVPGGGQATRSPSPRDGGSHAALPRLGARRSAHLPPQPRIVDLRDTGADL